MIGSKEIAAGTMIVVPHSSINRDRSIWGLDADSFRPERWITEAEGVQKQRVAEPTEFITFGLGPHSCAGKGFTLRNQKILIGSLIARFEFHVIHGTPHPRKIQGSPIYPWSALSLMENGIQLEVSSVDIFDVNTPRTPLTAGLRSPASPNPLR